MPSAQTHVFSLALLLLPFLAACSPEEADSPVVFNDTTELFAETETIPTDISTDAAAASSEFSSATPAPAEDTPKPAPLPDIQVFDIEQAEAGEVEVGTPVRLMIPSLKIDAPIEEMGLIENGKLDAPEEPFDAGWFKAGPKPGEKGNAVIDGHLDLKGKPAIFWDLKKMKEGDMIGVTDDQGVTRSFKVTRTEVYDVEDAPMREIFGKHHDGKNLNLITCAGKWRKDLDHYDQRLVVFTEMIEYK